MNNLTFNDMKGIYYNYFILIVIIIFVAMYVTLNYNKVVNNSYSAEDFVKPILVTCIIILICNLVVFSDDEHDDLNSSDANVYKIINDANIVQDVKDDIEFNDMKDQRLFKILNDNNKDTKQNENFNNKHSREIKIVNDNTQKKEQKLIKKNNDSDDEKYLNKNIFLPFKQNKKFQLKT